MERKKIFITGATGFIGANFVRVLSENKKYVLYLLVKPDADMWRIKNYVNLPDINVINGDLSDVASYAGKIKEINPDYIFHLAAYGVYPSRETDVEKIFKINFVSTMNFINALDEINYECLITTGSSLEYGIKNEPMKEDVFSVPICAYGASKSCVSTYALFHARNKNKPIVHARLFMVYGQMEDKARFFPQLMISLIQNKDFKMTSGDQGRDFVFVEDIVNGFIKIAENADSVKGNIINIGTGIQTKLKDFAYASKEITKSKSSILIGDREHRKDEIFYSVADNSKINSFLNWSPQILIDEGIKKSEKWFSENMANYTD